MISWFSGNCSTRAARRCTPSCETEVVVSAWWRSDTLWRCLAVVECDILRKEDWALRVDGMACLFARCNSNGFLLWGFWKGTHLCSPSQDYGTFYGRISRRFENSRCQHVKASLRGSCAAHCHLSWNGWRPLWMPVVTTRPQWGDHVIAWAIWWWHVSWKLNITGDVLDIGFYLFL
jgi:hypothetical protein